MKILVATIVIGGASQASAFGTSCVKDWFEYYQMSHNTYVTQAEHVSFGIVAHEEWTDDGIYGTSHWGPYWYWLDPVSLPLVNYYAGWHMAPGLPGWGRAWILTGGAVLGDDNGNPFYPTYINCPTPAIWG